MSNAPFYLLLTVGLIAAFFGALMLIVAAFRKSVLWGIVALVVPFGNPVFVCVHWTEARAAFLTNLFGLALCVGAYFTIPGGPAQLLKSEGVVFPGRATPAPQIDYTAQIAEKRKLVEDLQAAFVNYGRELPTQYQELEKRRAALKAGNEAAIVKFNEDAAVYQVKNRRHREMQQEVAHAQAALDQLLEARSRAASAATSTRGN